MLCLVSTPIGNMSDISQRAIDTLADSDIIFAEDTRRTGLLLSKLGIKAKLVSYNDANKKRRTETAISMLKERMKVCVVSDSGTPGISDPGYYLVRECIQNNIMVTHIPGATAFVSALICSGKPTDKFTFYGFLPKKQGQRRSLLEKSMRSGITSIFYESPYRIISTLEMISSIDKERDIVLARELTKKFETFYRGNSAGILKDLAKPRGEFVLVI